MNGESQPGGDRLDREVLALKMIWLGMLSGGVMIAAACIAIVVSGLAPAIDLGDLKYLFLLAVPLGLIAAFVLVPRMVPSDPATIVRTRRAQGADVGGWEGTTPDDAYYWFPVYSSRFLLRAVLLEVTAIFAMVEFFLTGDWVILAGAGLMLLVLATHGPSRAAVEAFAEGERMRRAS